ncbi:DNA repair protein RecO [Uliginosibacterium sp. H1]|uniref:DNA repair protein RecO n=1 Tax=Uliginosibacterium sp. H1 TaxID=3114757 RepID=UPI002E173AAF|nr:DNA repair protein RecO [Uliginosibacterium sp. H1]
MSTRLRIDEQPAYVLHSTSWRETSLIVEVFSRAHGRLPLVAKGARRPASPLRGLLMAFQPLVVGWSGRGEVKTLMDAQWRGGQPLLGGAALLSGYYLNELLLRLLPREDAHSRLFDAYAETLKQLAGSASIPPLLRSFELQLLRELGYAPSLDALADSGEPVREDGRYLFIIERGLVEATTGLEDAPVLPGHVLLAMARDDFSAAETQQAARPLMRRLLQHYLGTQGLESRRIFMELQEL